jgi:hypothetical protein
MAVVELKRFSFVVDFIESDPQGHSPDMRAGVLAEHDNAIRAAAARMTALLSNDTQIGALMKTHGIRFQTKLSH